VIIVFLVSLTAVKVTSSSGGKMLCTHGGA
jgi:hypothetical protein